MKNFKIYNKKLLLVILSGFILVGSCSCSKNKENNYQQNVVENTKQEEVNHNKPNNDNNYITDNNISINQENNKQNSNNNEASLKNNMSEEDEIVLDEFTSIKSKITQVLDSDEVNNFKDEAKGVFVSIVDFLFYDGEIKGIKFSELTENGKKQVLELASEIDSLITTKFPTYKEDISEFTKDAYYKAGEIIKKGAKNISEFSKEKLGEENYNAIINAKDELIDYTKNAFSIIGNFSSKTLDSVKDKVKNWYEEFRNNN